MMWLYPQSNATNWESKKEEVKTSKDTEAEILKKRIHNEYIELTIKAEDYILDENWKIKSGAKKEVILGFIKEAEAIRESLTPIQDRVSSILKENYYTADHNRQMEWAAAISWNLFLPDLYNRISNFIGELEYILWEIIEE